MADISSIILPGGGTYDLKDKNAVSKYDLTSIQATGTTNTTGAVIPAGAYFYLNGLFYKAKTQIDQNAPFTVDTNCEQATVGGELFESISYTNKSSAISTINGLIVRIGIAYIFNLDIIVTETIARFVNLLNFTTPASVRVVSTNSPVWIINHQVGGTQYSGFISYANNANGIYSSVQLTAGTYSISGVVLMR